MKKAQYGKSLTISLSPAIYEQIKEIADRDDVSKSDVARDWLILGMKEEISNG